MNPTKANTIALVLERIADIEAGKPTPKMAEQCQMEPLDAVTWQAALIITGKRPLLTGSQSKLAKATGETTGHVNRGLTLASADEAAPFLGKGWHACAGSTIACESVCVGSRQGQGKLPSSAIARIGRSIVLACFLDRFMAIIIAELLKAERSADRNGWKLAFRTNVATDHWQLAGQLATMFPGVLFYDYTAITSAVRANDGVARVYSRKDGRTKKTLDMLRAGHGAAVVFDIPARSKGPLPTTWHGFPVIDGDIDDLWPLRAPKGPFVVGLRVKGTKEEIQQARAIGFSVAA